jgi:HlyD family secretion protein
MTARPLRDDQASDPAAPPSVPKVMALPLVVVNRRESGAVAPRKGLVRLARFVPFVIGSAALFTLGGLVGVYVQPPGLRKVMETLKLEPGGGATAPFAVPAPRTAEQGRASSAIPAAPIRRFVVGLGKILPAGEVVTVAPPFGAGDARIGALLVKEGDP